MPWRSDESGTDRRLSFYLGKTTWQPCMGGRAAQWCHLLYNVKLCNIEAPTSDHSTILIEFTCKNITLSTRAFRFENLWLQEKDCKDVVLLSWTTSKSLPLMEKIPACGSDIIAWGQTKTGKFKSHIYTCRTRMNLLRSKTDKVSLKGYEDALTEYNHRSPSTRNFLETTSKTPLAQRW